MEKTKLEKFNLLHEFLFDETMADREVCQAMMSILLENEIEFLGCLEAEKKKFNLLNNSRLIRLSPFDLFGRGLYRYTFEGVCRECPDLKLEDGAVRIFINTRGKNPKDFSDEFLDLMRYIETSTDETAEASKSPRIKLIHKRICQIRKFEKVGLRFLRRCEDMANEREDGKEEGIEEGELSKLVGLVCKKLRKGKASGQIAEELEEDIEAILPICGAAEAFAPEYDEKSVLESLLRKNKNTP